MSRKQTAEQIQAALDRDDNVAAVETFRAAHKQDPTLLTDLTQQMTQDQNR
jgi:hypothetical protein